MWQAIGALVILFVVYKLVVGKGKNQDAETVVDVEPHIISPFKKRQYFFSKAERSFYDILQLALKDTNYAIFSKVRLLDLFYLPKNTSKAQSFRNMVQSKHVDFVVCDTLMYNSLLAIELDDSSHNRKDRIERDQFINEVFERAGFPLLRIPAKASYNVQDVRKQVMEIIEANASKVINVNPEVNEKAFDEVEE